MTITFIGVSAGAGAEAAGPADDAAGATGAGAAVEAGTGAAGAAAVEAAGGGAGGGDDVPQPCESAETVRRRETFFRMRAPYHAVAGLAQFGAA